MENSTSDFEPGFDAQTIPYLHPVIAILALIGNTLSYLVYSRPSFAAQSASFYLRIMAITDSLVLIDTPELFKYTFNYDIATKHSVSCKILLYFAYSIPAISSWILTIVSLDRMLNISISMKNKMAFLSKNKFQHWVIIIIFTYNSCVYAPLLVYFDVAYDDVNPVCLMANGDFASILGWFDIFNSTLVPFCFMLVSSIVILSKLIGSRARVFEAHLAHDQMSTTRNSSITTSPMYRSKPVKHEGWRKRSVKDRQLAITLICMNLLFLFMNICLTIMNIVVTYMKTPLIFILYSLALYLFRLNFTLPFVIYFISNCRFRNELKDLVKSWLRK